MARPWPWPPTGRSCTRANAPASIVSWGILRHGRFVIALLAGCYIEPDPPILANTAFVTSRTVQASSLHGTADADDICRQSALAGGLPGNYVAWISTATTSAASRLPDTGGWLRPDGRPVADSKNDLLAGRMFYPLRIDEHGEDVVDPHVVSPPVITGTNPDGRGSITTCSSFGGSGDLTVGMPDATTVVWTDTSNAVPCDTVARLYCFGVDVLDHVVSIAPTGTGKLAFVSERFFSGTNGPDAADQICADEATAAGVPGSFAALLARSGQPLAKRFAATTYVRPDHVAVTTDLQGFVAPLNVTLGNKYIGFEYVWTGAPSLQIDANDYGDCMTWSPTMPAQAFLGDAARSDDNAFGEYMTPSCSDPHRVYCLEK